MATKTYNKTILQTSFTSLESIYYLLQTVKKNQPITHLQGTDEIFPQARARISQARGGEWDEEKRDTHAELTLKEMMLIRYNEDETFEVSDLGNSFLEAFNLIEEPAENGKVNISISDNLTLEQRNQFLLDVLLRIVVEQPKFNRCIHPYLILFKLLTDTKLYGYISKSEWACFINNSDYIRDTQYIEIRDRLVEVRNTKEQIDAQKSDRILTRLVLWNVLAKIEEKIDGSKQTFFCLHEDFAQVLSCYLLSGTTYKISTIKAKIINQGLKNESCIKNLILYGPPGTGKTHKMQKDYISKYNNSEDVKVVTFHQSYSYEEFVEGLKPVLDKDANNNANNNADNVKYTIEKGIFYEACERAAKVAGYGSLKECIDDTIENRCHNFKNAIADNKTVLLCIDEINRGNVASIFGDLISLIEPSKRLGAGELEMTAILPYSKEPFGVPANLFIVGTMNTADRSIQLLDSALRRRFKFEELLPNYDVIENDSAKNVLENINARVRCLLNKDNQIGHSYLMHAKNSCDILSALYNKIIPLLEEYFYNDITKVRFVLNDLKNAQFYVEDTEAQKAYQLYLNEEDVNGEEKKFFKLNSTIADAIDSNNESESDKYLVNLLS